MVAHETVAYKKKTKRISTKWITFFLRRPPFFSATNKQLEQFSPHSPHSCISRELFTDSLSTTRFSANSHFLQKLYGVTSGIVKISGVFKVLRYPWARSEVSYRIFWNFPELIYNQPWCQKPLMRSVHTKHSRVIASSWRPSPYFLAIFVSTAQQ